MNKWIVTLLGVCAAALVTIAVVLVTGAVSDDSNPERDKAEKEFREQAEYECAFQGIAPLSQPSQFEECVDAIVKRELRNWDETSKP